MIWRGDSGYYNSRLREGHARGASTLQHSNIILQTKRLLSYVAQNTALYFNRRFCEVSDPTLHFP